MITNTDGLQNNQITNDFLQAIDKCNNVQLSNLICPFPTTFQWILTNPNVNDPTQYTIQADCGNCLTLIDDGVNLQTYSQTLAGNQEWSLIPVFQSFFPYPYGSETPTTFFPYTISYVSNDTTYYLGVDENSDTPIVLTTGTPSTDTTLQWYMLPIAQVCGSETELPTMNYTIENVYGYNNNGFLIAAGNSCMDLSPGLFNDCACCPASTQCANGQCRWILAPNPQPTSPLSFSIASAVLCTPPTTYYLSATNNSPSLVASSVDTYWNITPLFSISIKSCSPPV